MALTDAVPEPPEKKRSGLAALLPFTTIAMILAALYVVWTFYSRHESARKAQEAIETKQREAEKRQADLIFGSGEVKFTMFSADNGTVKRGETTRLCYGVVNATTVKIDPSVGEPIKPTNRHCVEITPRQTTTYTITASNGKGDTKTSSLTVHVE
jgi:hypothetical protein